MRDLFKTSRDCSVSLRPPAVRRRILTQAGIPPTYAPPRPPPTGKALTNRQKMALAAVIIIVILLVALVPLILQQLGL